jgi:molybdopterin molybdotransferase
VLAEPLVALTDLPPFDTSAMDGWVVSGPGPWNIRDAAGAGSGLGADDAAGAEARAESGSKRDLGILAGRNAPATLPDGDAVRIATGARIPADANAVIRSEHARVDGATRLLHAEHQVLPGQDIRPRGQECRAGDRLMPAGALVTPAVLGLAAAAGYDTLVVVPRPRVDVLVLGDELLTGGLPHDGLIRDALGPMIGPWLRALGAEVLAPQRLGDDAAALRHALTTSDADVVITTGGTAAGPVDHVHPVLAEIGAELLVDGVAVRPGHPMLLARLKKNEEPVDGSSGSRGEARSGGPYVVGLPGNPLAAVSGLLTLAEPLLRGLAGREQEEPYRLAVRDDVHGHPRDTRLVPVVHRVGGAADGRSAGGYGSGGAGTGSGAEYVVPLRYNGPAMLRGIAAADGLAVVPPGGVRSGTEVEILDLPWASAMPWTEGCFT